MTEQTRDYSNAEAVSAKVWRDGQGWSAQAYDSEGIATESALTLPQAITDRAAACRYAIMVFNVATAEAEQPDADVAELARMIHSAVFVSDLHGGTLTPASAGRFLRGALRTLSDEDVTQAIGAAAQQRGRSWDGVRAFVPPF